MRQRTAIRWIVFLLFMVVVFGLGELLISRYMMGESVNESDLIGRSLDEVETLLGPPLGSNTIAVDKYNPQDLLRMGLRFVLEKEIALKGTLDVKEYWFKTYRSENSWFLGGEIKIKTIKQFDVVIWVYKNQIIDAAMKPTDHEW